MKYVPYTVVIPEVKPGQGVKEVEIMIPVVEEDGIEILTPQAHDMIDKRKMQETISRLVEAVRELYQTPP